MAFYPGQVPGSFSVPSSNIKEQAARIQSQSSNPPSYASQNLHPRAESSYYQPAIRHSNAHTAIPRSKRQRASSDAVSNDSLQEVMALLSLASMHDVEKILAYLRVSVEVSTNANSERPKSGISNQPSISDYPNVLRLSDYDVMGLPVQASSRTTTGFPQAPVPVNDYLSATNRHSQYNDNGTSTILEFDSFAHNETQICNASPLQQLGIPIRDSLLSNSSSNSLDTTWTSKTKRSSASTTGSRGSTLISADHSGPGTQSSSAGTTESLPLPAPVITSRRSTPSVPKPNSVSLLNCSYYPTCLTTFTRPDSRIRHENQKHNQAIRYTCLLDTCTSSCSEDCSEDHHVTPFSHTRADKFRTEHLEPVHGLGISKREISLAWTGNFVHEKSGWRCGGCGEILGTWHDNADGIEFHYVTCVVGMAMAATVSNEEEMRKGFKRLSFEMVEAPVEQEVIVYEETSEENVHDWRHEQSW